MSWRLSACSSPQWCTLSLFFTNILSASAIRPWQIVTSSSHVLPFSWISLCTPCTLIYMATAICNLLFGLPSRLYIWRCYWLCRRGCQDPSSHSVPKEIVSMTAWGWKDTLLLCPTLVKTFRILNLCEHDRLTWYSSRFIKGGDHGWQQVFGSCTVKFSSSFSLSRCCFDVLTHNPIFITVLERLFN